MIQSFIDGDIYKYRWAMACEYDMFQMSDGSEPIRGKRNANRYAKEHDVEFSSSWHVVEPVENCLHSIKLSLTAIQERYGKVPVVYLHGSGNYRNDLYPEYKQSRLGRPIPALYAQVVDYLVERWSAIKVDGIETDDQLAIEQSKLELGESVICSIDKDLYQVPGLHYDMVKLEEYRFTPRDSDFLLYQQILTGDRTDDIPGIEGIGPVKAADALAGASNTKDLYNIANDMWGGDRDSMHLTAQLIYLLRSADDSYLKRKEVVDATSETMV